MAGKAQMTGRAQGKAAKKEAENSESSKIPENPLIKIKFCKSKGAISVKSPAVKKLNLQAIRQKFSKEITLDTPIIIVLDYEGQIIVHSYGELMFKDLRDESKIAKIAEKIFRAGEQK